MLAVILSAFLSEPMSALMSTVLAAFLSMLTSVSAFLPVIPLLLSVFASVFAPVFPLLAVDTSLQLALMMEQRVVVKPPVMERMPWSVSIEPPQPPMFDVVTGVVVSDIPSWMIVVGVVMPPNLMVQGRWQVYAMDS